MPHRKHTAEMAAVRMPAPEQVVIPMAMHIGKPAEPVVQVGDEVFVGSLIAEQSGYISSPIYSSVSGKVKSIGEIFMPNGIKCRAITVVSDGNMTPDPTIQPPSVTDKASLVAAVQKSGTVGLGGAGFPTYVKFNVPDGTRVEVLVVNGAECEPYITSDTRTMVDKAEDMLFGIQRVADILGIERVVIGIESNKPAAIESMRAIAARDGRISVSVLPSLYPQGGEKVLVYHTTGKVIPAGKLPLDVGCIVINCTTIACIGNYIKCGMPLVSKCITVDGGALKSAANVIVPIGTSLSDVFEFVGGFSEFPHKVLLGGPMMGVAVDTLDAPVMKNTNAILALTNDEIREKEQTACIRCGACVSHCPLSLNPQAYLKAYKVRDVDTLEKLRVDICMECGCCSYICPTAQPLVETNKLAKALIRERAAERRALEEQRKQLLAEREGK